MITVTNLTKTFGDKVAVDDLSFTVREGAVTGFLGPNGSGKSTTMRLMLGLDRPSSGSVLINGKPFRDASWPLREVGALLEASSIHPGRSAYNHLRSLAAANGIAKSRVDEVLYTVGLTGPAKKRAGGFSLGMGQRLGIAAALLGDPEVLLFDEPVNGLDPEGIVWVRTFLRSLAAEGRTVFVSSHLMAEMAMTADYLVVIGHGKLKADTTVEHFIAQYTTEKVKVKSPELSRLADLLASGGHHITLEDDSLIIEETPAALIGELADEQGIVLHELSPQLASLEEAFMELTSDDVEFHGQSELSK
ncbi:MAG: ATP-binding cassette domain-containing protein [Actinomycetota bacterium]